MNEADYSNLAKLFVGYAQKDGGLKTIKDLHHSPTFNFNYLLNQKFPEGPFYRTLSLDKLPEIGDIFESDYSGWFLNKRTARGFPAGPIKLVVYTNRKENLLISFKSLVPILIDDIPKSTDLYGSVLGKTSDILEDGRDELIMTPFKSKIKSIEKQDNFYYAEV